MTTDVLVTRLVGGTSGEIRATSSGMYCVEHDGELDLIYVAGSPVDRWVFWNGRVFHRREEQPQPHGATRARPSKPEALVSPMPARVVKLPVQPGAHVKKGDTIVLLEAMKMELPIRAPASGIVSVVHCREGDLVAAGAALVELLPQ